MKYLIFLLPILLLGCVSDERMTENTTENITENITENENETVEPECACTLEFDPVCGEDEVTYQNNCTAECAGVEIQYKGRCQVEGAEIDDQSCEDSDGGVQIHEKGTVTAFGATFVDSCSGLLVKEYYCEDREAKSSMHECPEDFKCVDGKCVRGKIKCTDTDGGNDIYEAGTVTIQGLIEGLYLDKCVDHTVLKEYYCENDELAINEVECEIECKQARCLQ